MWKDVRRDGCKTTVTPWNTLRSMDPWARPSSNSRDDASLPGFLNDSCDELFSGVYAGSKSLVSGVVATVTSSGLHFGRERGERRCKNGVVFSNTWSQKSETIAQFYFVSLIWSRDSFPDGGHDWTVHVSWTTGGSSPVRVLMYMKEYCRLLVYGK